MSTHMPWAGSSETADVGMPSVDDARTVPARVLSGAAGRSRLLDTVHMRMTRYFHYLSKAKVDMLYDQLDMSASSRSTRFGFDLKILAADHEVHQSAAAPSMYEKLRAVEEAIERSEVPGSVDEPQPYIRDRADLWSIVIPSRVAGSETGAGSDTVLFCGESRGHRPFVLGGAASHMQPAAPPTSGVLNSNFFYLQREIVLFTDKLNRQPMQAAPSDDEDFEGGGQQDGYDDDWDTGHNRLDVEPFMYDSIKYLAELHRSSNSGFTYVGYSEFLARVVRVVNPTTDAWSPCAVLATPLYVCQIETSGRLHW